MKPSGASSISIGELATFIEQTSGTVPVSILWGAGASKTAGIPLASKFVAKIRRKYPESYAAADHTYMPLMTRLSAQDRRNLITPFVTKANVNWAHIALAQLLKGGFVQYVFTTNFDNLLERACHTIGFDQLSVYDLAAAPAFHLDMALTPAIVYLHGKYSGFYLINTGTDAKKHAKVVGNVLWAARNHLWLVIGYSGENDNIFPKIRKIQKFLGGSYWAGIGNYPAWGAHVKKLCESDRDVRSVQIKGADECMTELAARLGCFPPALFLRPARHVNGVLKPVPTCKAPPLNGADLTSFARRSLAETLNKESSGGSGVFIRLLREIIEKPLEFGVSVSETRDVINADPELRKFAGSACFQAARLLCEKAEGDRKAIRARVDPQSFVERFGDTSAVPKFDDGVKIQNEDHDYFANQWRNKIRESRRCLELSDEMGRIVGRTTRDRLDKRIRQLESDVAKHVQEVQSA